MISTQDLEAIAAGRVMDSTQAPQIARELIAARKAANTFHCCVKLWELRQAIGSKSKIAVRAIRALQAYDAAREAE